MSMQPCFHYLRLPILSVLLLAPAANLMGAEPDGYYDLIDSSSSASLKQTLHEVIDDHLRFPYTSDTTDTWDIINLADEDPLNPANVLEIYHNASYTKIAGGTGAYNREHSWPKSYGFPNDVLSNYPYTDVHHLFAADASYNSSRGNLPYRQCDANCLEKPTLFTNGEGGGTGFYPGNSNWRRDTGEDRIWQTWRGRQGDVARALFYMSVRYEGGVHAVTGYDEPDLELTDDMTLLRTFSSNTPGLVYMGALSDMLQWHINDPVDDKERRRNDIVFSFQGTRNPFVDHPEWVACVFGTTCGGGGGGGGGTGTQVALASAEQFSAYGSVFGSYLDTHVSDDVYQTIDEAVSGGKPSRRTSYAEHTWSFSVPPDTATTVIAELRYDGLGDDGSFLLKASSDGVNFQTLAVVVPAPEDTTYQSSYRSGNGGTTFLRLVDADRSTGNTSIDSVAVDALRITFGADGPSDTTPPDAPLNLVAKAGDGLVNLSWDHNQEADLAGYIVLRATSVDGFYDPLNVSLLTVPDYTDTTAENGLTYYYAIVAVDTSGNESGESDLVSATPQAPVGGLSMSVVGIDITYAGKRKANVTATIQVADENGKPVVGATISGVFSGDISETAQTITDESGVATAKASTRVDVPANVVFCVDNVEKMGSTFMASANDCS